MRDKLHERSQNLEKLPLDNKKNSKGTKELHKDGAGHSSSTSMPKLNMVAKKNIHKLY